MFIYGKSALITELNTDGYIHVLTENFRYEFKPAEIEGMTVKAIRYPRKGKAKTVTVKTFFNGFLESEAILCA